jgi:ribonucleotide reductase beta subunit family protein with ferritin-like domain
MYSLLIDSLVSDEKERNSLFEAVETIPAVGKKAAWAQKWLDPSKTFAERLVAWICVEGLLFSGSFCAIFWLRNRGVMPGLGLSNEFISRDEGLHQTFGEMLYSKLENKLSFEEVRNIVTEAVANEKDFICDAIPCKMIGMNSELMSQYIEFVADRIFVALGHSKFYNSVNPFDFMELISLQGKTNFFEKKVADYQRAGILNTEDNVFGLDADF